MNSQRHDSSCMSDVFLFSLGQRCVRGPGPFSAVCPCAEHELRCTVAVHWLPGLVAVVVALATVAGTSVQCPLGSWVTSALVGLPHSRQSPTRARQGNLPADFTYSVTSLVKPLAVRELKRSLLPLHHAFGFEFGRRNNLHFIKDEVVLSIAGNSVQLRGARCQTCLCGDGDV